MRSTTLLTSLMLAAGLLTAAIPASAYEVQAGKIFNGAGQPIDGLGPVYAEEIRDVNGSPINPVSRTYPRNYIRTGISSIDTLMSIDKSISAPELARNIMPIYRLRVSTRMADWLSSGTT